MEGGGQGWFQAEMGWRLGHSDRVKFWDDVWVGNTNLKSEFPKLYSLSCNQSQTVEEVGGWEGDVWRWNLRWRRAEWESVLETDLTAYISRTVVKRQEQDIRVWGINNKGCFSVKSAYASIRGDGTRIAIFDLLWKAKAFPSVLITAWRWIDILSVQHNALQNHFESFTLTQVSNKQEMVWKAIWAAIVRSVWEHRNLVVFKQGVVDAEEMFQQAQLKSWLWMKYRWIFMEYFGSGKAEGSNEDGDDSRMFSILGDFVGLDWHGADMDWNGARIVGKSCLPNDIHHNR
ncbi:uncharacterized protein [Phaseolus vulgaris]|uniref:uncharacterized protein n=1 Tax=Phaseolus vulgaris TaxID=3885 RepID=UPI0035CC1C16